jgi:DNA-binding IclR family transcriptional regulator
LRDVGHAELVRLAEVTGESAQIYVLGVDNRICVDSVPSTNEVRTIVRIGAELPLTAGSAGKVFLAWMSPEARERRLRSWERLTEETPTPEELEREFSTIRRRGWAQSVGERKSSVGSVSAPVLGARDTFVVGVVSISGPRGRIGKISAKRFAPAVLRAAREIERAAGYQA